MSKKWIRVRAWLNGFVTLIQTGPAKEDPANER